MPFNVNNLHEFGPQDLACASNVHDEDGDIILDESGNPLCAESVADTEPFTMEITITSTFPPFEIVHRNIGVSGALIYDYYIDWGDGDPVDHITSYDDPLLLHTYGSTGTYTVTCMGQMESIGFPSGTNPEIRKVLKWGRTGFKYLQSAFGDCYNMTIHEATDLPDFSICETVQSMFYECRAITTGAENWSFQGALTSLRLLFDHCDNFNSDCSGWNTTGITDMYGLFNYCVKFNNDITGMDTSAVTDMRSMFFFCDIYNHASIVNLDVSACTQFDAMLSFAQALTQDISGWTIPTTAGAVTMAQMFRSCDAFNVDIDAWNVSEVTDMREMFSDAFAFNQGFPTWDTGKVTDMSYMFAATFGTGFGVFNGNISNFDTSSCTTMNKMLHNCDEFNHDISGWDISNVANFTDFMSNGTAFTTANYDLLLNAWAALTVQAGLTFRVAATYTIATSQTAHDTLDNAPNNWTFVDGGGI